MSSGERFGRLTDAPATLLLRGARLIDPGSGADEVRDLAMVEGLLADPAHLRPGAEALDAAGWVLAPGFVDLHTHLREPGAESAETVASGTRAAARGGFTTICAMPNTDPPLDHEQRLDELAALATEASCRVQVIAAVTAGRRGERVAALDRLAAHGAVGVSDDGAAVPDSLARGAVEALVPLGIPLVEHAEDPALSGAAVMRQGPVATRLGLAGWRVEAETRIVERDLELAAATGARLHLTHLSTSRSVALVREAKERGIPVTADVTPHHLAMTDSWVAGSRRWAWEEPPENGAAADPASAYDAGCRVNPPLGHRDDAMALLAGLRDGTIDAIATDHAPHPAERKLVPFGRAAPGMIGLETALSIGIAAVHAGMLDLMTLVAALSSRPAAVIGERRSFEIGSRADLVAFDPRATWRVQASALASKSSNTPLLGMELPGVVRLTVADGRVTYRS